MMRFLRHFAIPNLTVYLIVISGVVSFYAIQFQSDLGTLGPHVVEGQWWHLIAFPFRIAQSPLWIFFYMYGLWLFGGGLEQEMGSERYTGFIALGLFCEVAGALLLLIVPTNPLALDSIQPRYLYLSIFLAAAIVAPNFEILLFFILPVKIKWPALILAGLVVQSAAQAAVVTNSLWPFLGPLLGLVNVLVFFGPGLVRNVLGPSHRRKSNFRAVIQAPGARAGNAIHRCTICGITENDDPHMQFRYCVDCADHEYCEKHLAEHPHIKT
ncbi:MAG: hypothetical protein HY042_02080 [Spirochaetia bacterium]|nr:hypothetical protein [Spirochaetia bacterium]